MVIGKGKTAKPGKKVWSITHPLVPSLRLTKDLGVSLVPSNDPGFRPAFGHPSPDEMSEVLQ